MNTPGATPRTWLLSFRQRAARRRAYGFGDVPLIRLPLRCQCGRLIVAWRSPFAPCGMGHRREGTHAVSRLFIDCPMLSPTALLSPPIALPPGPCRRFRSAPAWAGRQDAIPSTSRCHLASPRPQDETRPSQTDCGRLSRRCRYLVPKAWRGYWEWKARPTAIRTATMAIPRTRRNLITQASACCGLRPPGPIGYLLAA
jgi:hypothetical protein